jgi:release factor glutamine methyltransferase
MPNISEILKKATNILQSAEVSEPHRESVLLLAFALQKNKTFLIAHPEYQLTLPEEKYFDELLTRRTQHEPFQHITGVQEFYGLDFAVTAEVLIPRPETELIVENAIEILRQKKSLNFCEIGIGSGCIAISILHEIKTISAIGLDISAKALRIAKKNAEKYAVLARLDLKISDVLSQLTTEKFDLIVSNPPYIPISDILTLQPEVSIYEPLNALTDEKDGLSIIEKIINQSPKFLNPNGFLLMEIGYNQSRQVKELFLQNLWQKVDILPDLQGIPRMVRANIF